MPTDSTRLQNLLAYFEQNSADPFLAYALALEYQKWGDTERSSYFFDTLLEKQPDYLPTYYQAAAFFAETGHISKAKLIYEKGIELAKKQNETKTLKELNQAYLNFCIEYED